MRNALGALAVVAVVLAGAAGDVRAAHCGNTGFGILKTRLRCAVLFQCLPAADPHVCYQLVGTP